MSDQPANGITIEIMEDGPLIVKGLETLENSKGEKVEVQKITALCRCGHSSNKPFCDSRHVSDFKQIEQILPRFPQ